MKFPKVTIDPSALRHGFAGNTWKEWGLIALAFGALYAVLAGYLTGMLFAATGIRQDNYRTMSVHWFGPFDRELFSAPDVPLPNTGGTENSFLFNRPSGCDPQEVPQEVAGVPNATFNLPNGILDCAPSSSSGNYWQWIVYPWVLQTNGAGRYPGCSNEQGAKTTLYSYLSSDSSPAASDAANATLETQATWVCQNGVAIDAVI